MLETLWLVHPDDRMCDAFRHRFDGLPGVRVVPGAFENLEPHDAFVTAGNAFGIMTAGIDAAVVRFFGDSIMRRVQHRIMDDYFGEQPVGTAFIMPTDNEHIPFLVHAPTMRVPGSMDGTDKAYSATWASLLAIHAHNRAADRQIEVAAMPAMGTGFGGRFVRRGGAADGSALPPIPGTAAPTGLGIRRRAAEGHSLRRRQASRPVRGRTQ